MSTSNTSIKQFNSSDDIVRMIMAQHWDMAACPCWICNAGRALDIRVYESFYHECRKLSSVLVAEG